MLDYFAFITSLLTPFPALLSRQEPPKKFRSQMIGLTLYQLERRKFLDTLYSLSFIRDLLINKESYLDSLFLIISLLFYENSLNPNQNTFLIYYNWWYIYCCYYHFIIIYLAWGWGNISFVRNASFTGAFTESRLRGALVHLLLGLALGLVSSQL